MSQSPHSHVAGTAAEPIESQEPAQAASASVDLAKSSRRSKSRKSSSAFRTISEVAEILGVQQHVLRFWETKFSQVRPLKRGGGRRYYRPEDVELLKSIHHLLYTEGYTIKGVQKLLKEQGKKSVVQNNKPERASASNGSSTPQGTPAQGPASALDDATRLSGHDRHSLEHTLLELKAMRSMLVAKG